MNVHLGFKSGIEYDIQCEDLILTFDNTTNKIKGLEFKKPSNAYPHYINVHQIESICQTFTREEVQQRDTTPIEVESEVINDEVADSNSTESIVKESEDSND